MKLLYFSVIKQHAGWGAEWFLNAAFEEAGHQTICVDYREQRHRLADAIESCPAVDALLVQRGDRFPLELLKAATVPSFFLATELVERREDQHPLMRCSELSHIFVRTQHCADLIVERGWQSADRVSILLSAYDPSLHRRLPDVEQDIDVLFLGGMTERRRRILDSLSHDLNVVEVTAFGEEMVRYFNRAKIVLNIHAEEQLDVETRVFEALGSGACLVSERLDVENPFSDRQLIEVDDPRQLEPAIRHYLAHDDERRAIADAGHLEARNGHTYLARARQIVTTIGEYLGEQRPRVPFERDTAWYLFRAAESQRRLLSTIKRGVFPGRRGD